VRGDDLQDVGHEPELAVGQVAQLGHAVHELPEGDLLVRVELGRGGGDDSLNFGVRDIVVGLAPEVEIYSVRVLGADLRGKGAAFLAGLEWAVEQGVQAMNLSLSSKSERLFPFFHEIVDQAYFKNVALICAVNNVPGLSFPSTFSSVFSVAAHAIPDPETFFYNPAPPVEWGAWGVDVPIGWKDGGTTVATGNSFAAPHMCGLVARILSKHPGLTPFEVKTVLAAIASDPST